MADKKNINYTNNDGAKFRYSYSANNAKEKKEPVKKAEKIKEALTKRSVFWKTNRAFAIFVLVAVILISSAWSVYRAVSGDASDVKEYYEDDGIRASVVNMVSSSNSLISINEAVNPDSELNADCREIAEELSREAPTPFWNDATLAKKLHDKSEAIYNLIAYGEGGSAEARADAGELYSKIDSYYKSLGDSNQYADAAADYNKTISKFPASVFPIDKAPVFERFSPNPGQSGQDSSSGVFSSVFSWIAALIAGLSIPQIVGLAVAVVIIIRLIFKKNENK